MSNCIYCNGTGYESIEVEKYDGAMNENYKTHENRMCQYCGGRGHHSETSSTVTRLKSPSTTKKPIKTSKGNDSDIAENIAGISLILAVIMAYFIYHSSSSELNIFVATIVTFIISNVVLHVLYILMVVMTKLGEFVLAIAFWGTIIIGVSYASGADWALKIVTSF